jgi:hypothetical protein
VMAGMAISSWPKKKLDDTSTIRHFADASTSAVC